MTRVLQINGDRLQVVRVLGGERGSIGGASAIAFSPFILPADASEVSIFPIEPDAISIGNILYGILPGLTVGAQYYARLRRGNTGYFLKSLFKIPISVNFLSETIFFVNTDQVVSAVIADVTIAVSGATAVTFEPNMVPLEGTIKGTLSGIAGAFTKDISNTYFTPANTLASPVTLLAGVGFVKLGENASLNPLEIGARTFCESNQVLELDGQLNIFSSILGSGGLSNKWRFSFRDLLDSISFGILKNGWTFIGKLLLGKTEITTEGDRFIWSVSDKFGFLAASLERKTQIFRVKIIQVGKTKAVSTLGNVLAFSNALESMAFKVNRGTITAFKLRSQDIRAEFINAQYPYQKDLRLINQLNAIISNGQSLSVGAFQNPLSLYPTYPNNAYKLRDSGSGTAFDGTGDIVSLVPLAEPIRPVGGIAEFPNNIMGESGLTDFAAELIRILGSDFRCAFDAVGVGGDPYAGIKKGGFHNSYAKATEQYGRLKTGAVKKGWTLNIPFEIWDHGQTDWADTNYLSYILEQYTNINADHRPISGQPTSIPLLITQQSAAPYASGSASASTIAQWQAAKNNPGKIVLAAPNYQYYAIDAAHMERATSIRRTIKMAEAGSYVIRGRRWRPIDILSATIVSTNIVVKLTIPQAFLPLNFDPWIVQGASINTGSAYVTNPWVNAKGFEAYTSGGVAVTLGAATITGDREITIPFSGGTPSKFSYAMRGQYQEDSVDVQAGPRFGRRGAVRNSNPYKGSGEQIILCTVTNGSAEITSAGQFERVSHYSRVTGIGLSDQVIVENRTTNSNITLTENWAGATGKEYLVFAHEQRDYLPQFEVTLPYSGS